MEYDNIKDKTLFNSVSSIVKVIVPRIRDALDAGKYISHYDRWPSISYRKNGLPDISEYSTGPLQYSSLFKGFGKTDPAIKFYDMEEVKAFLFYVKEHDRFKKYYSKLFEIGKGDYFEIFMKVILEEIIDRYIHIFGLNDFAIEKFKEIYLPIETCIFSEKLSIDIAIPILFLKFDFDNLDITNFISIEKMNNNIQLSRITKRAYSPAIASAVISSATHALILRGYEVKNEHVLNQILSTPSSYPLEKTDLFFNSLRIVTGMACGYAQLLAIPKDWASHYKASLTPLEGITIKAYPNIFDQFYWNRETIPSVSLETATEIGKVYVSLLGQKSKKIIIACKRLGYCYLRENEEDSILDAIIALESLLSDGDKGELTYKLAVRMAALLSLSKELNYLPKEIFDSVKKIYSYRSAIIHGNIKSNKKREIKLNENTKPILAIELSIEYLRNIIKLLMENQQYLDVSKIDERLFLNKN